MELKDFKKLIEKESITTIRLWFTDVLGMLKGFSIPAEFLERALTEGVGFDGSSIEGFVRIFESDLVAKPDKNSYFILPEEVGGTRSLSFICDVLKSDGTPYESDPRYVLKKNLEDAGSRGYKFYLGPELEYFYFPSDHETTLLDRGGYFDILPTNPLSMARTQTMLKLLKMGIRVEASHHEVAPGQQEIDFVYDEALKMADQVQVVKLIVKEYARLNGLYATFMPKPVPGVNGTGMHVHQSLFKDGENVFYNGDDPYQLSSVGRGYIAGLLKYAREMTVVTNQWVNSYKRIVPGYEAPVYVSWGRTNRSALVRVPAFQTGKSKSCRSEYRAPDPGCNPYLCFSVMLRAGLSGLDEGLELVEPMERDIFKMSAQERIDASIVTLPGSLKEAIDLTRTSKLVKQALGEDLFNKYIANKDKEWDRYRIQVTDYELKTYLPML